MQWENTANDLLFIKDFKVFMNNSIKPGQTIFSHGALSQMSHMFRPVV